LIVLLQHRPVRPGGERLAQCRKLRQRALNRDLHDLTHGPTDFCANHLVVRHQRALVVSVKNQMVMIFCPYFQFHDSWNYHHGVMVVPILKKSVFQRFRTVHKNASVAAALMLHDPLAVTVLPDSKAR
jgi:hypothetical protein